MRGRIFLILLLTFICGCRPNSFFVSKRFNPYFREIPTIGSKTVSDVGLWLSDNITYIPDTIHGSLDYWQTPYQTYVWRAGDCEDFALLMMYIIRAEIGGWPELVLGVSDGVAHAWVFYEGEYYEPQTGRNVTKDSIYEYCSVIRMSYGVAMWNSMYRHTSFWDEWATGKFLEHEISYEIIWQ
jgi:hypothetical protein